MIQQLLGKLNKIGELGILVDKQQSSFGPLLCSIVSKNCAKTLNLLYPCWCGALYEVQSHGQSK
jgi:hypothetical protein